MAHESSQSTASSSTVRWRYNVFLSFYGKDTRLSFTDHLYDALGKKGITVFRDNENLQRGEYIPEELMTAIKESEFAVVVMSQNYANSKWCLMELTEIMDRRRAKQLTVFPVFYQVDPADVRKQEGIFGKGFARHTEIPEIVRELWRVCLEEVAGLAGWHVYNRYESAILEEICSRIFDRLSRHFSGLLTNLVGLEPRVKEMMDLLCIEGEDVRFVGICGMGGIGKTTLANVVYDSVSSKFKHCCYIENVRKNSKLSNLISLQKQLIVNILKERNVEISCTHRGQQLIAERVQKMRVFIVLDDVDVEEQLKALAGSYEWFGPGSRILITSRDMQLLRRYVAADKIYMVEVLNKDDALQLFCLNAFKKHNPKENFMERSRDIVKCADGLPLALELFGSLLYCKTMDVWEDLLDRLKEIPRSEILERLKISYDGLQPMEQKLFLDIACFFNGANKNSVIHKLESLGHYSAFDIDVLKDKCLIKISNGKFNMHDLLVSMGRQIVHDESPNEPGYRSRLWCHEDIIHVLEKNTGTDLIEGIVLRLPLQEPKKLNFEAFSQMTKLRMLVICCEYQDMSNSSNLEWSGDPSKLILSDKLGVMEWWGYPLESWPTSLQPLTHPRRYARLDIHTKQRPKHLH